MDELQRFLTLSRGGLLLLFCWGTEACSQKPEAVGTIIITVAAESETSWGRLEIPECNPPAQNRVSWNRLLEDVSSWVLNILKDGNTAVCLGKVFQCSIALTG